jgi:hypothetical protein
MDLYRVKGNGCQLYFPETFSQDFRYRGSQGFVVDLDAPLEREWCAGQMHKLEPAPDATEAAPVTHPVAIRLIKAEITRLASLPPKTDELGTVEVGAGVGADPLEVKPARTRKAG